jgi:isochorismate synthase
MTEFSYEVSQYRLESSLIDLLQKEDSFFSSSHGIFINRGAIDYFPLRDIKKILAELDGQDQNDRKPFIVFGHQFSKTGHNDEATPLPKEMIHIDSHNWVTHFLISSDTKERTERQTPPPKEIEHPHHVELMSPESKDQFTDKVEQVLKHIAIGDAAKVVISRQLNVSADIEIDTRLLIAELLDSQPESYVFAVNGFVGASPELLVEKFSRTIRCLPMAGTRRRHARRDEDDADIADLRTNSKDRSEHKVVIDDIISKLSMRCSNVTSSSVPHVVRLPHVSHLATSVTATTTGNTDLNGLIEVLHPTPAVAGTPTDKAMKIISEIEGFNRGNYGAPVGWIDSSGDGQCAIALRCAKIEGSQAQLYAGVGIVEGSDPSQEWDETQAKFGVMRDAMMNITQ